MVPIIQHSGGSNNQFSIVHVINMFKLTRTLKWTLRNIHKNILCCTKKTRDRISSLAYGIKSNPGYSGLLLSRFKFMCYLSANTFENYICCSCTAGRYKGNSVISLSRISCFNRHLRSPSKSWRIPLLSDARNLWGAMRTEIEWALSISMNSIMLH